MLCALAYYSSSPNKIRHQRVAVWKEEAAIEANCRAVVLTLLMLALSGMAMAAQQTTAPAPAAQPAPATSSSTAAGFASKRACLAARNQSERA